MNRRKNTLLCGIVLILTLLLAASVSADVIKGGGPIKKFKSAYNDASGILEYSATFVNIPGMSRTFKLKERGKMIITFNAEVTCPSQLFLLQAQVDGKAVEPSEVMLALSVGDYTNHEVRSYTWVTGFLKPGSHTVRIMWRTPDGGSPIYVARPSMMVLYNK